jgi:DNA-binding transcriptional LysR family regulator
MNRPAGFDTLSIAQLRLFGRVALLASFSAAARELSLSQPAASRSIASMEAALGGQLFLRTTRRVRLTSLGEQLLERLFPMLEEFERLDRLSVGQTQGLVGTVRAAAPGAFGRRFIAPATERFLLANPRASVDLVLADRRGDLVA